MHKPQEFYQKLAYLFYSVAGIDGKVDQQEVEQFHKEVLSIWKKTDTDAHEYDTSGAIEIEAIFDWLDEEGYDCKDAFEDFKSYYQIHTSLFDSKTKNNIIHTCTVVAEKFHYINKSEQVILNKITNLLK